MESRPRPERPRGRRFKLALAPLLVALALPLAGCGDDDTAGSFSDKAIVKALMLERLDGSYAVEGDPFCEVDRELLNDAGEVEKAEDRDRMNLVLRSRVGNVGIRVVPVFAPGCATKALKALDKLDPPPGREKRGKKRGGKDGPGKNGGPGERPGTSSGGGSGEQA